LTVVPEAVRTIVIGHATMDAKKENPTGDPPAARLPLIAADAI
jgi:hypothetical protein